MSDEYEIEDVEDALRRADELAELTGRAKKDIIADLLDDGQLNLSAGEDSEDKKDFLDVAQEQAEKLKSLLTTLIPIFALLMGIGAEGLGVVDITGWGEDSMWESEDPNIPSGIRWGCMDGNAINYDPMANEDDNSCLYDTQPPCNPYWNYQDYSHTYDSDIFVDVIFEDLENCNQEIEGQFLITLYQNGNIYTTETINTGYFSNRISVEMEFNDLAEGEYRVQTQLYDLSCGEESCQPSSDWNSPYQPIFTIEEDEGCDAYFINEQAYLLEDDDEHDAIKISADVTLVEGESNCDSEQFEITWRLYEYNNPSVVKYEHKTWESGVVSDSDGADYVHYTWDSVDEGSYEPKVILKLNGEILDEKMIAHSLTIEAQPIYGCTDDTATNYDYEADTDDGSCEYPPEEPCEVEVQNHYRGHVADDEEQDAILIAFKVVPTNCEGETLLVEIDLFQDGYGDNYSYDATIMGDEDTDISHIFDDVAVGDSWTPRITVSHTGTQLEEVYFWGIDVVEPEPENCEINLYAIQINTNSTTATVGFDLDCGEDTNDLDGYNVTVQFLVYHVNETNSGPNATGPLQWVTQTYFIEGYADDPRYLVLDNFSVNNTTHYDFYWYAMWEVDGEQEYIEQKWMNREVEP